MANEMGKNPQWHSMPELRQRLAEASDIAQIREATALRAFLRNSLYVTNYRSDPKWAEIIVLTASGKEALAIAGIDTKTAEDRSDVMLALFCLFFHHELLVDCSKCNLEEVRRIIDAEIRSRLRPVPHRFGRLLYDKFNNTYGGDRTEHLLPDESLALVDGTSQGVYQVGQLVSGPLGLLNSDQPRYIPPSLTPRLWHCSDPGCGASHNVRLLPVDIPVVRYIRDIRKSLDEKLGPVSEWGSVLPDIVGGDVPREPYTYFDICSVIADCIVGTERESLLSAALTGNKGMHLREILSSPPRKKSAGQGAPETISKNLSQEEQLQLLFLLENSELLSLIDKSVGGKLILVPSTELRKSQNTPLASQESATSELSSLGIRCSGSEPIVDLCALIWDAYSSTNRTDELDWRLRNNTGIATRSALLGYLCQNEPAVAVKEVVLASEPVTRQICERIGCSIEDSLDSKFVEKVLWKLGFDLPRFSETLSMLRRRLDSFSQELLAVGTLRGERDRERIRSVGVNLFVSVEEFLQQLLCYNVWLLSSDHFLTTKFKYDSRVAMRKVAEVLGETVTSGAFQFQWKAQGENPLGTLLAYLHAAVTWMESLHSAKREELLREESDLPHYADDRFKVFPYTHTMLWADADYSALGRFIEGFRLICEKTARANLASIRNGLDHQRDEATFPKIDEMLAFVAHFREVVDSVDVGRYFPKEFWVEKGQKDRFGRTEVVFKDYSGRLHTSYGPTFVHDFATSWMTEAPALIAPGRLMGFANGDLMLRIKEGSVYADYWDGYPRRRNIPSPH